MMFKLVKKWKSFCAKQDEKQRGREERCLSLDCPYCDYYYTKADVYQCEEATEVKDLTVIKCANCNNVFGVKKTSYYDPVTAHFNHAVKLGK